MHTEEQTLTRGTAGVTVWPADITASNNRLVRRGWQAGLLARSAMSRPGGSEKTDVQRWCPHSHKSTEAAVACGRAMWRELPTD